MYRLHVQQFASPHLVDGWLKDHPTYVPISTQWLNGVLMVSCREEVKKASTLTLNRGGKGGKTTNN